MKQEERRNRSTEKLIKAYLELAAEEGVASITFDTIGQRAGYSRGLAFQKFGSKEGLLEAVINYLHGEVTRARSEARSEAQSGLEALILFCRVHLLSVEKGNHLKAYFVLLSSSIAELSDMRAHFQRSHDRSEAELTAILHRGIEDGSIRDDIDVKQSALMIGTHLMGISTQSLIQPDFDLKAAFESLRQQTIRAYGTPKAIETALA